jgi:hypothetical protein
MHATPPQRRAGRSLFQMLLPILVVGFILGGGAILGAYMHYRQMRTALPAIDATGQFIMLVGSGNISAAKGMTTDAIDIDRLTDTVEQIAAFGPIQDVNKYYGGEVHDDDDVEVQAMMNFGTGSRLFTAQWTRVGEQWLLRDYAITDAPATQPATQPQ